MARLRKKLSRLGMRPPRLRKKLARLAYKGYEQYLNETLRKEIKANPAWEEEFSGMDGSRVNVGFYRWQSGCQDRPPPPLDVKSTGGPPGPRTRSETSHQKVN